MTALLLAAAIARPAANGPVLWLNPGGQLLVGGRVVQARLANGAKAVETPVGLGLDFSGGKSGFLIPDYPLLHLSSSLTVSTWVYLRGNGSQAQIFFRGDDRPGLDPYHLSIEGDGKVSFSIESADGGASQVRADMPVKAWTHLTGVFDEETNEIRLYLGDRLAAKTDCPRHPFRDLDANSLPGVSIGNVESDKGLNNQPLDGIVADLRLYDVALSPREAGYVPLKGGG